MNYEEVLKCISKEYKNILRDNLIGIYVHGSIVLNCFNFDKSDIDYIVVVNKPLTEDIKLKLMDITIELNKQAPPKGLEMSIVLKEYCTNFIYPTPFELHFSNRHVDWYNNDSKDYCEKMIGFDKDLAAHFTIIKNAGIVLYGLPINQVFAEVPREDYLDSIKNDISEAKSEIYDNPVYIILNLCRVLAYVRDNLNLSKKQGGEWGICNLNRCYHKIINEALYSYKTNEIMKVDEEEAKRFCEYMLNEIN
ncbi:DUF4111 domain-containing protein [Clostridium sp. DSM 100503]|nr:aminoglycoside adenylyltransferase domain-containing protein [Clostridium sp. DSM 100503]MCR1949851.1 DUF4111 domain-containing protein [Clostridium sp. DSM 100503]